jgi:hypothetical protein
MPMGLADALTHQEFLDLVRFLADLGKPGPYGPSATPVVRRWQVLDAAQAANVAQNPDLLSSPGSAASLKWSAAYSLVSGDLPADAFASPGGGAPAIVRCEIEVTAPGKIGLRVKSPGGLKLYADGQPVAAKQDPELELSRGIHSLTFQLDAAPRAKAPLRVELREVPGSSAAAQVVGGA